jgi:CRP-like cAMP-binding protein
MEPLIQYIDQIVETNDREKNIIRSLFKVESYKKGEFFLQQGLTCRKVGFIIRGLVAYYIENEDSHVYWFGKENEFVCNYESFLTKSSSTKSIKCIEGVDMACISYDSLQILYEEVQNGEKIGRIICERLFVDMSIHITSFYTDTPEERYLKFLDSHPDLIQRIPQYLIASFIKVQPPSLSRIRKRMAKGN